MKKVLVAVLTTAAFALPAIGLVQAPAHAVVQCPPNISGATIQDSVIVPAGQACSIQSSTINGSITVYPGGSLSIISSTVNGSITANSPEGIVFSCFGAPTVGCSRRTVIGGNVVINGTTGRAGPVFISPTSTLPNFFCATDFHAGLTIENSGPNAPWRIGACSAFGVVTNNTVAGTLNLTGNQADVGVFSNSFGGNLNATGNSGGGSVTGNTVTYAITVTNNSPCWQVSGNTAARTTADPCGP